VVVVGWLVVVQGLKPKSNANVTARLNSCPVTKMNQGRREVGRKRGCTPIGRLPFPEEGPAQDIPAKTN
jgi:hypothetical protein